MKKSWKTYAAKAIPYAIGGAITLAAVAFTGPGKKLLATVSNLTSKVA